MEISKKQAIEVLKKLSDDLYNNCYSFDIREGHIVAQGQYNSKVIKELPDDIINDFRIDDTGFVKGVMYIGKNVEEQVKIELVFT